MPDSGTAATIPQRKGRWRRRIGISTVLLLAVTTLGLIWLNGPGWRWATQRWLPPWLKSKGIHFHADFEGSLSKGITIRNLKANGAKIRNLQAESINLRAPLQAAWTRKLQHLSIQGLHLDWDLDGPDFPPSPNPTPSRPQPTLDQILTTARNHTLPGEIDLRAISATIHRGPQIVAQIGPSSLTHTPLSPTFSLSLGSLEFGNGHALSPQSTTFTWDPHQLQLDQLSITRRLTLENITATDLHLPIPHLATRISFDQSQLQLTADSTEAHLQLSGTPLTLSDLFAELTLETPVNATLHQLDATLTHWNKPIESWTGTAAITATKLQHPQFDAQELKLQLSHQASGTSLNATLKALDTTATLEASASYPVPTPDRFWENATIRTKLKLPDVHQAFAAANRRYLFLPTDRPSFLPSSLEVSATTATTPSGVPSASARWTLSATDPRTAPAVTGTATWNQTQPLTATVQIASVTADASVDLETLRYEGKLLTGTLEPSTFNPWLRPFLVTIPSNLETELIWQGNGSIREQTHSGESIIRHFRFLPPASPQNPQPDPITASLEARYAWPDTIEINSLAAHNGTQALTASARWAFQQLEIPKIEWKADDTTLVHGRAKLPLPLNQLHPKDYFVIEQPLEVFLESEWITTNRLANWLPQAELPVQGAARTEIRITGTPAQPRLHLETAVRDLTAPQQPQAPPVAALVTLRSQENQLQLEGNLTPKGYNPITIKGNFPFNPRQWALEPSSLKTLPLKLDAKLPRLDLSSLQPFLPKSTTLTGLLEGDFQLTGSPEKPQYLGNLNLRNASLNLPHPSVPPLDRINASLRLLPNQLELSSLTIESAGGSLRGNGSLRLPEKAEPTLDFRINASSLPLLRDESMIVRGDTNLTLTGPLSAPEIRGNLNLVDSLFYKDFEILPVRVPFTAPARPKLPAIEADEPSTSADSPLANWKLNVRVRTQDPLLIRGNLASGSATADILVAGTLQKPALSGKATIDRATARLPFSTLNVRNGTATFSPDKGFFPELNLRGTSSISGHDVSVFFYGPANSPKTALTSDPPLPESEIMTLLATGTTTSGLEGGQAASLKAAQLLVEEWRRGRVPFAETLADWFEILNRIDVRVGEDDPLTGRRQNSATLELSRNIYVSGAVDKQGNTRLLGAFVIRFK